MDRDALSSGELKKEYFLLKCVGEFKMVSKDDAQKRVQKVKDDKVKCANCGFKNKPDSIYCQSCGNELETASQKKLRRKHIILGVLILAGVCFGFMIILGIIASESENSTNPIIYKTYDNNGITFHYPFTWTTLNFNTRQADV